MLGLAKWKIHVAIQCRFKYFFENYYDYVYVRSSLFHGLYEKFYNRFVGLRPNILKEILLIKNNKSIDILSKNKEYLNIH